jgi:uncharacterized transporter YbjL
VKAESADVEKHLRGWLVDDRNCSHAGYMRGSITSCEVLAAAAEILSATV